MIFSYISVFRRRKKTHHGDITRIYVLFDINPQTGELSVNVEDENINLFEFQLTSEGILTMTTL
jgi:hypothetical protein